MIKVSIYEIMDIIESAWNSNLRQDRLNKAINLWYDQIEPHEHKMIYEWIIRVLDVSNLNERQEKLIRRYDPNTQVRVEFTDENGVENCKECYKFNGKYWINENSYVANEYITKLTKIWETV